MERCTKRCATAVQAREEAQAAVLLPPEGAALGATTAPESLPPLAQPTRIQVGRDGIPVRSRTAQEWLEVQAGSLWSAWKEFPHRKQPQRELTDVTCWGSTLARSCCS